MSSVQPVVLTKHLSSIYALCRKYGVRRLDLFGSATTAAFDVVSSDLDFVVEFAELAEGRLADRYLDLAESLEQLLGRPVELLTERSIRNPYLRREIDKQRQKVYEQLPGQAAA